MSKPLTGKVALITGASSGIGEAAALCLTEVGASVALVARRIDRLNELAARITAAGGTAIAVPGDITVEAEARRAVEETIERLGRIDILVNSAGVMEAGGIEHCDTALYRKVFDINLMGTVHTCAAAVPHMLAQGAGDIITISSLAARKGGPMTSAYSASKHAVNVMTDGMRQELGGRNIRVTTLMPGATETEVGDSVADPQWRKAIQAHVSREGVVKPRDIGETIVFILSLPRRANISEIAIRPTMDTSA